jgi:hypothetical protein
MGKFDRWPWRKLYCVEKGPFAGLPLYVRALAAEMLKFTDDEGRIWVGEGDPVPSLARLMGAHQGDVRLLRKHLPELVADGYLVRDGGYLVIRNQTEAQGGRPPSGPSRGGREVDARSTRGGREVNASQTRGEREFDASFPVSARNHSGEALTGARALLRKDKIREEGRIPPPPCQGEERPGDQGDDDPPGDLPPARPTAPSPPDSAPPTPRSLGVAPSSQVAARLAAAWTQGVRAATGRPCTVPARRWDLEALTRSAEAHGPQDPAEVAPWLAASVERFAAVQTQGAPVTPERWETWLNAAGDGAASEPDLPPFEELPEDLIPPPRWGSPPTAASSASQPRSPR